MSVFTILRKRLTLPVLKWDRALYVHDYSFGTHASANRQCAQLLHHEVIHKVSAEEIAKYKHLYDYIDHDKTGIKVCDFVKIMRELGLTATEDEIESLFERLNLQSYGVMTEREFVIFISKIKATSFGKLEVESQTNTEKGSLEKEPTWWSGKVAAIKSEVAHYKRGFLLLFDRLKFASNRTLDIVEGRTLSHYESRKVFRAAKDFLILIPVAAVAMLPGGSVVVAFFVKYVPQFLPSTFRLENMTHQRKNELVITEVTAAFEEMELRLNREKVEWIESDASFVNLMEFVMRSEHDSLSLQSFLYNKELNFLEDPHLKANAVIDRLDSKWLLLLCQASLSTAGSGKYDPKKIQKSPLPILRSLLKRRFQHIAENNKKTNKNHSQLSREKVSLERADTLCEVLVARGFPPSLTLADTRVWMQLEDSLLVLLSFIFQLRGEYRSLSSTSVSADCNS
jgi:hypothetical protein